MRDEAPDDTSLRLWGGIECTVNRVGNIWYDQMLASGHTERGVADLERIAALGVRTLRYPVLWETHSDAAASIWAETDARLHRLRELGIEPVVGLLHHGSGPAHTNLLHADLPSALAEFARIVAQRYPWVRYYTPINEPLTTARFSTLYGHWYPHARDDRSFALAVVNQCRAIGEAMAAIRTANPAAMLLQTEDVGRIYGTSHLQYQVELENERRWLTWDLLCGRLTRRAPMSRFLLRSGIAENELAWFVEHPCPPDLLGVNHYVTSDRFIDERVGRFAASAAGGNGRDRYADVEAVRVLPAVTDGWRAALDDTWNRFHLPIVISETHLGCSREEQLRWLADAWFAAGNARERGLDVRAVTAWALLGSYNWSNLLTRDTGDYEPGAFDVRGGVPRPTALSHAVRELASGMPEPSHPVAASPGWWCRDMKIAQLSRDGGPELEPPVIARRAWRTAARPLLITGAEGNLGAAFVRLCKLRGLAYHACNRQELNICSAEAVRSKIDSVRPWAIINAAGFAGIDAAERDPQRCFHENSEGPRLVAELSARHDLQLVTFSSDLVFDGASESPYVESSAVGPLGVFGLSKARAEREVIEQDAGALVVRVGSLFSPWHGGNFLNQALCALARKQSVDASGDVVISPTYVPDLVDACLDLLIDGERGIWHLANVGASSCADVVRHGARLAGFDQRQVVARSSAELALAAVRPAFSVLATERGMTLPPLEDALSRFVHHGSRLWSHAA